MKTISFAVFVKNDDSFIPVSYGETQFECECWLTDHKQQFKNMEVFIGKTFDFLLTDD